MSLPEFPTGTSLTREAAINQIISSIAMEELGLSHIINAEGEKLQYVLGTIPGISGPAATIEDILKVNESVRAVLQNTAESQMQLRNKLQNALSSAVLTGPTGTTGATGATGAATIAVDSEVVALEPEDAPTVVNTGTNLNAVLRFGIPRGATGALGSAGDTGPAGEAGPAGPTGTTGATGATGAATIAVDSEVVALEPEDAPTVVNTGTNLNAVLRFGIPRGATGALGSIGPIGPAGDTGLAGVAGPAGPAGATGPAATANSMSALNTTGATIAVVAAGTNIPMPSNQSLGGFTANAANELFTAPQDGTYMVSYNISLTTPQQVESQVMLNGAALPGSTVTPITPTNTLSATVIANLTTGNTLALQLFNLASNATLQAGNGANLVAVRLS